MAKLRRFRASGPGGQHVNKNRKRGASQAQPSGVVVTSQQERASTEQSAVPAELREKIEKLNYRP